MSHFTIVGGGSKHNLRANRNIYTILYGSPMEILQLPHRLVKITWNHRTLPLILKPYFISISYKGLKHSNIRRNVNSVMFSNVFVLHHIHSLPCETSVLSLTPRYFGDNSPDQTCFLTHKPSLVTSEQSWAQIYSQVLLHINLLHPHVTKPEDLNIIERKTLWNLTQPPDYLNLHLKWKHKKSS